ncbi:hypothetical protein SynBOUM118_00714 [Synechococcus sp. BOUM118]|nr:hypothetical protein SynBOUM118_00714 [Synechococcus sp. BOUM118]
MDISDQASFQNHLQLCASYLSYALSALLFFLHWASGSLIGGDENC